MSFNMGFIKAEYKDGDHHQPMVKKEEAEIPRNCIEDIPQYFKQEEKEEATGEDTKDITTLFPPSPPPLPNNHYHHHHDNKKKMSHSQPLCTLGDVAVTYRMYVLDDVLAEPQEVCHDWGRNLLYVAQRYRQGHAYAPIEPAREIAVVDLATAQTCGVVDLGGPGGGGGAGSGSSGGGYGYSAPHALELDPDAAYLAARVAEGMVWIDAEARCVTNFVDRSQMVAASANTASGGSTTTTTSSTTTSSSSSSSRRHHSSRGSGNNSSSSSRHGHGNSSNNNSNSSNNTFIAEVDLRSGKIRQRVMVPDSEQQDPESGLVAFSSPAIRFASRQSSDGMPVVAVEGDPLVAAIRHKFGVKTIYITSRNVMLV